MWGFIRSLRTFASRIATSLVSQPSVCVYNRSVKASSPCSICSKLYLPMCFYKKIKIRKKHTPGRRRGFPMSAPKQCMQLSGRGGGERKHTYKISPFLVLIMKQKKIIKKKQKNKKIESTKNKRTNSLSTCQSPMGISCLRVCISWKPASRSHPTNLGPGEGS